MSNQISTDSSQLINNIKQLVSQFGLLSSNKPLDNMMISHGLLANSHNLPNLAPIHNNNMNRTNDILIDNNPVTNNRFNNMTTTHNQQKIPYYVSGTPIAENNHTSVLNHDNFVPYNGVGNSTRTSSYMPLTDCTGKNIWDQKVASATDCMNQCISRDNCKMWSFDNRNQHCYIKNDIAACEANKDYVSGRISVSPIPSGNNPYPTPPSSGPVLPGNNPYPMPPSSGPYAPYPPYSN
ncbi:hypothetical protein [Acanthamoeba polyphaga mimivirus]|uniref:Apple domain-containing protein n=5 Tax=Megamimivirinae TaxID=3044648 RepID=A0A2L2DLV0_MIMIV|nr:hypothetical protein MegaChil _gp0271 [Megavirus chiliensis]AFX92308.1 hypothetical protein CE11_00278 [Megavirus courdo11]AGD92178.1 hypothetical protein LBA_00258 [Megavirus lba]AUV58213.1 hypothetical protein [Bandra megavirus]AVG46006.1 hypothetical protein [Acanthamoeba polyphaga mimivirus]AEQ32700.1 PAN domain-containing protein [Megavirus chiliensis]